MCRLQKAYRLSLNSYLHIQGPNITAFQTRRLSAQGAPEMPPGGSEESLLKSRINRRLDGVDWHQHCLTHHDRSLSSGNASTCGGSNPDDLKER